MEKHVFIDSREANNVNVKIVLFKLYSLVCYRANVRIFIEKFAEYFWTIK